MKQKQLRNEDATRALGAELAKSLQAGDVVLLSGELGAGKTTLVRGILAALGHDGPVRSPSFNLLQVYDLTVQVVHADLYRLTSADGLGLDQDFPNAILLVEWPDRAPELARLPRVWQVHLDFKGDGRLVRITPPEESGKR